MFPRCVCVCVCVSRVSSRGNDTRGKLHAILRAYRFTEAHADSACCSSFSPTEIKIERNVQGEKKRM